VTRFSSTVESTAVVKAPRKDIWAALTDPALLTKMTPFLQSIEADGDTWVWHMRKIGGLGVDLTPVFTEQMTFDDGRRITYAHKPPAGTTERAGAEGTYNLSDVDGGTKLDIKLTIDVELPLPKAAKPAVSRVMRGVISTMGDRFSANLIRQVGATA
jgi:carbon monoxide dehydrogenase subunit G